MIYLTPQASRSLPAHYGQILTPEGGTITPTSRLFAVDNGVYTGKFAPIRFMRWLGALKPHQVRCLFVAAPDVVSDYRATLAQYGEWYPILRAEGWPVAYVAQDGSEKGELPECQAVFIGGSTEWKMSNAALEVIRQAKRRLVWVHVGRVNSQRRIRHFQLAGVDSVDGTTITFSPDRSMRVLDEQLFQLPMWRDL